ncbi:MAG: energy transducer TonB [Janthinobacterium lividum]
MRSLLLATALCLPALGSAQAVHTGVSHMVALMDAPEFAFQGGAIRAGFPRVFSGIVAPVRLTGVELAPSGLPLPRGEAVVEYTVDAAGIPKDVHVVKPLSLAVDKRLVEAVSRVRYTPGTLDGMPVAVPVTLHIAFAQ